MQNQNATPAKYLGMAAIAFIAFGSLSIYWSFFNHIDSYEILFHRCLWTFFTLAPFLFYKSAYKIVLPAVRQKWPYFLLSAFFMGINWFTFIYAVNNQHVFEAGLAYFISPLITIVIGFLFLKESMSSRKFMAVLLVCVSLTYLLIAKGIFPKYALIIGCSFSLYGVTGRKISFSPVVRMVLESFLIFLAFMIFFQSPKELFKHFIEYDVRTQLFLFFSGTVTVVPMILYILSVKHVKFSTVGVLSFILPTMIFLLGIFYFQEKIDREKVISISLIWIGVSIYIYDLFVPKKSIRVNE